MTREPSLGSVREAEERIRPFVHRTPVLTSRALNEILGAELYFKCENLQRGGAFKIRGATNAVLSLSEEEAARGVATHSSGNFGAALALAARARGIRADVVMPESTPAVKREAVAGYGARITMCESTLAAREAGLAEVVARTGATFIHPFDNYDVICGQGTAALELSEDVSGLESVMAPVGGGGLLSGTAIAVRGLSRTTAVIAAEPERADDAYRSLQAGRIVKPENPDTIADGLRTSLGELTFPLIRKHVDRIVVVSEEAIIQGMRLVWERMKLVIEPSAAVPVGALLTRREEVPGSRIGVILSGGNVDLDRLPWMG